MIFETFCGFAQIVVSGEGGFWEDLTCFGLFLILKVISEGLSDFGSRLFLDDWSSFIGQGYLKECDIVLLLKLKARLLDIGFEEVFSQKTMDFKEQFTQICQK